MTLLIKDGQFTMEDRDSEIARWAQTTDSTLCS